MLWPLDNAKVGSTISCFDNGICRKSGHRVSRAAGKRRDSYRHTIQSSPSKLFAPSLRGLRKLSATTCLIGNAYVLRSGLRALAKPVDVSLRCTDLAV
jgi:hypothetical protein